MKTYSVLTNNAQADFASLEEARDCFDILDCPPGQSTHLVIIEDGDIIESIDSYYNWQE